MNGLWFFLVGAGGLIVMAILMMYWEFEESAFDERNNTFGDRDE
jgi:hypothetical protein